MRFGLELQTVKYFECSWPEVEEDQLLQMCVLLPLNTVQKPALACELPDVLNTGFVKHMCMSLPSALFLDVIDWINHDVKSILKPTMTVIRLPPREALSHSNYSSVGITFLHKWLFTSQARTFCFIGQLIVFSVSSCVRLGLRLSRHYLNTAGWPSDDAVSYFHCTVNYYRLDFKTKHLLTLFLRFIYRNRKLHLLWVESKSWGLLPPIFLCTCHFSHLARLPVQLKEIVHTNWKFTESVLTLRPSKMHADEFVSSSERI